MLVSIVITTLNSARTIGRCLSSITAQTYRSIETIVVDNHSSDDTASIAASFGAKVIIAGPERSAQRNIGIREATGDLVAIIDSDMTLEPAVIERCVDLWRSEPCIIAIPERSVGEGFWARCKALERSCYVADEITAAARVFERSVLLEIGGYDESLHAAEDWDLSIRAEQFRPLRIVDAMIDHDEGRLSLVGLLRKKYYYGKSLHPFIVKHGRKARERLSPVRGSLLTNLPVLFANPLLGFGVVVMKGSEMLAGVGGMIRRHPTSARSVYRPADKKTVR